MKKIFLFIILIFFNYSCLLIEPVTFIIQNNSDYKIKVNFDKYIKKEVEIEKKKEDFFLFYPDNIKLTITIEEIEFKKEYDIKIEFMKDYKFNFELK